MILKNHVWVEDPFEFEIGQWTLTLQDMKVFIDMVSDFTLKFILKKITLTGLESITVVKHNILQG